MDSEKQKNKSRENHFGFLQTFNNNNSTFGFHYSDRGRTTHIPPPLPLPHLLWSLHDKGVVEASLRQKTIVGLERSGRVCASVVLGEFGW